MKKIKNKKAIRAFLGGDVTYMLRTCQGDMSAFGGFVWPETGPVEAPEWNPGKHCGHGLHGLLHGEGDGHLLNWHEDAKWLVVAVAKGDVVDLGGKVKVPKGWVVCCGDRRTATGMIAELCPEARAIVGHTATAGDYGTATAGHRGTATAGYYGTATAGYYGTATAGPRGTAAVGDHGTAIAGHHGTATAGDYGTATADRHGTATAGDCGAATVGAYGAATAGACGEAAAGERGVISILWPGGLRERMITGHIGENGLEPNTLYRLNDEGQFARVES